MLIAAISAVLYRVRKIFFWQLTVSEVSFIGEDGVHTVLHVHPAYYSKQTVFEHALEEWLPAHMTSES